MKTFLLALIDRLNLYRWFHRHTRNTATVFMLHRFTTDDRPVPDALTVTQLADFLEYLKRREYRVLSLAEYVDALTHHRATYKTVVFTIDDGYHDVYEHAFPVFRRYGVPFTVFVTGGFVEHRLFLWWDRIEYALTMTERRSVTVEEAGVREASLATAAERSAAAALITERLKRVPNEQKLQAIARLEATLEVDTSEQPTGWYAPLTWEEIREMAAAGGSFYPHTMTHPILTQIPYEEQLREVTESRRLLEQRLGTTADIFCYPNGGAADFDTDTIRALQEAGYRAAVTGLPGFDRTDDTSLDPFHLHRLAIPGDAVRFRQYVSGLEAFKARLRQRGGGGRTTKS